MRNFLSLAALALPALLLAGCTAETQAQPAATVETAAAPQPQTLTAYASPALQPALQAYAAGQGVTLTLAGDASAAELIALDYDPAGLVQGLDAAQDPLLGAAALRAGLDDTAVSLPVGRSLYGYWANAAMLDALLGEGGTTALQNATWAEWSDFVETLQAWLAEPGPATVTLAGSDYALPEAKPDTLTATGVFAQPMDRAAGYTAALLAAGAERTADTLTGPLNGVYSAAALEWDNLAQSDETALFRRAKLTDLMAAYGSDACQSLVLVPFKCNLEESDLSTEEYNLTGLLNYPVLAQAGTLTVNVAAGEEARKAAEGAVLWLYSSGEGEAALTETLGVITPWNTAYDGTALGAMQVQQASTGILPGAAFTQAQADALAENEAALQGGTRTSAERRDFTARALEILGAAATEE